jgi:hypothetical protein
MKMGGSYGMHYREEKLYKDLVGKAEGKRPLGRPSSGWKAVIRIHLSDIGWGALEWIQLAQYRDRWRDLENTVINLQFLSPCN